MSQENSKGWITKVLDVAARLVGSPVSATEAQNFVDSLREDGKWQVVHAELESQAAAKAQIQEALAPRLEEATTERTRILELQNHANLILDLLFTPAIARDTLEHEAVDEYLETTAAVSGQLAQEIAETFDIDVRTHMAGAFKGRFVSTKIGNADRVYLQDFLRRVAQDQDDDRLWKHWYQRGNSRELLETLAERASKLAAKRKSEMPVETALKQRLRDVRTWLVNVEFAAGQVTREIASDSSATPKEATLKLAQAGLALMKLSEIALALRTS